MEPSVKQEVAEHLAVMTGVTRVAAAAEGVPPAAAKADDEASRSDLPVPVGAPGWIQQAMQELVAGASVKQGDQPILSTNPAHLQVHALVSGLETQAATVGDGSSTVAEAAELDRDQVWELLSIMSDQPEDAPELQMYGRPPAMADLSRRRCIYAEIGTGKRRIEARKQARINRDKSKRQAPAEQEHFDKWMNSGGKRAVVQLQLSNGQVLQRRAGRVDRTDGWPPTEDLRYYQYSIDTNQADEKSKRGRNGMATVYHVYSKAIAVRDELIGGREPRLGLHGGALELAEEGG